jgi:hypothetical protein
MPYGVVSSWKIGKYQTDSAQDIIFFDYSARLIRIGTGGDRKGDGI